MKHIDEMDVKILNQLKMNARTSLKDLSAKVHLSSAALGARIEKLEKAGFIKGYHTNVDLEKLGYKIRSYILVTVAPEDQHRFYDFIKKQNCVIECDHITGQYSMLIKVAFPSTSELDEFIGELQEYGNTETQLILSTIVDKH